MENETVVIEILNGEDSENVVVYPFDKDNRTITGGPIETTTRIEASEAYEVVGELFSGNIRLYDDDLFEEEYEEDYSEFRDFEEEDD
jgi:hypothetical protein